MEVPELRTIRITVIFLVEIMEYPIYTGALGVDDLKLDVLKTKLMKLILDTFVSMNFLFLESYLQMI